MTVDTKKLRDLANAATNGPWFCHEGTRLRGGVFVKIDGFDRQVAMSVGQAPQFDESRDCGKATEDNAAFIAAARTAIPELLDQLDAARSCIYHLANRLAENPDLAYHFDPLTRSTELLAAACDAMWGAEGDETKKRILAAIAKRRR